MNIVTTLFALLPLVVAQVPLATNIGWDKLITPFKSECMCRTGVDPVRIPKWVYNYSFPQDSCLKCYIKCTFAHLNVLNPDGTINLEANSALNKYVPGRTDNITYPCADKVANETDLCDKMFKFSFCIQTGIMNAAKQNASTSN
ncbi:hypothetical protein FQR65_LT01955 [Abscondita terminalis]|nr:hypothetical protein FQR65_LT01955 [Abscondita terminalis]